VTSHTGLARWAGLGGIAYVVAVIIGVVLVSDGPDGDAPPAEVIAWYSDSGNRDKLFIAWVIFMVGLFAFLWFIASLRNAVASLDDTGILAQIVGIGGGIYVALAAAGLSLSVAIDTMNDDTYKHTVYPGIIHAGEDAFWLIYTGGFIGMSALIIATSIALLRARAVRPWLGWLSVAAGIISIAAIVAIPQIVAGLWLIVVSFLLFRARIGAQAETV
jgi:hypothetical protein